MFQLNPFSCRCLLFRVTVTVLANHTFQNSYLELLPATRYTDCDWYELLRSTWWGNATSWCIKCSLANTIIQRQRFVRHIFQWDMEFIRVYIYMQRHRVVQLRFLYIIIEAWNMEFILPLQHAVYARVSEETNVVVVRMPDRAPWVVCNHLQDGSTWARGSVEIDYILSALRPQWWHIRIPVV